MQEALYRNLYPYAKIHAASELQTSSKVAIPEKSKDKNFNIII